MLRRYFRVTERSVARKSAATSLLVFLVKVIHRDFSSETDVCACRQFHQILINRFKHVCRRRYERCRSPKPKLHKENKNTFCGTPVSVQLQYWNSVKNCFPTQHFTEIGQSAAKLWPENDFQYGHNKILCTSKSEAAVIGNKKTALYVCWSWLDKHEASSGLSATAELLVNTAAVRRLEF